ncbi:tol-pal system protein YbgF [Jannaschia ovalis]|uniref:Cell division coordinator CpoB n=1 Tax=Jannaschia ovalis TaxID=3038773 RepID=A0ABY8LDH7_9RHOB|nr:tol-pal system protein YbgF [Jannaschia sp. GRR-S6-38]WGH79375.1 tol-pal system protein YbgF [Jannaschia sp. GRR-S6-38]
MRLALVFAALLALPAQAQQDQTLADIRQQLSVLQVELQGLTRELSTTGAPAVSVGGSSVLERIDSIEAELRRLTQATERMSFRIESVAQDGGRRIEDLRFQLCELTPDCELSALPAPTPLGGAAETGAAAGGSIAPAPEAPAGGGAQMAVGEQAEFDAAQAALEEGRNAEAAQAFERFLTAYPTGPLSGDAQFFRGQALAADGQAAPAARAYLEAFSGNPEGTRAPAALLGLGRALGELGQTDEACLTLAEVGTRFPQAPAAGEAQSARAELGCL